MELSSHNVREVPENSQPCLQDAGRIQPEELEIVKSVVAALDPFKVATNFFAQKSITYHQQRIFIRFTAIKLEENADDLSGRFLERLIFRYNSRENTPLVSLVKFFQKSRYLKLGLELQNARKRNHSQEK